MRFLKIQAPWLQSGVLFTEGQTGYLPLKIQGAAVAIRFAATYQDPDKAAPALR